MIQSFIQSYTHLEVIHNDFPLVSSKEEIKQRHCSNKPVIFSLSLHSSTSLIFPEAL